MNLIQLLKKRQERTIILDTSALESEKIMQVIEKATKVILLCSTIEEMDRYKTENSLFGRNIREVSRRSRKDKKSDKYVCIAGYNKHSYNDKNIIDYCRVHKRTIIVTSDNNLCNIAKAYGIHYIFLERNKKQKELNTQQVKGVTSEDKNLSKEVGKQTCNFSNPKEENEKVRTKKNKEIRFCTKWIRVNKIKNCETEIKVEREGKLIDVRDYQVGDYLYLLKYSRINKYIDISINEIVLDGNKIAGLEVDIKRVYCVNEIYRLDF